MRIRLIPLALAAMAVSAAAAAQPPEPQPAPAPPAPPTEAQVKALFESACSTCHDTAFVGEHKMSRADWDWTVSKMISRGAELSPDEQTLVVDYLAKTYPAPDKPAPSADPKPPSSRP